MKHVRTRLGFEAVTIDAGEGEGKGRGRVTLSREPVTVSNELADEYVKLAEAAGVRLKVTDVEDGAEGNGGNDAPVATAPVDLSAGVAHVTGQGDAVTSDDVSTDAPSKSNTNTKGK